MKKKYKTPSGLPDHIICSDYSIDYLQPLETEELFTKIELKDTVMEKKYKTLFGLPARIICVDFKASWPVIALIDFGTYEAAHFYRSDLTYYSLEDSTKQDHKLDLVEVQPYEDFKLGDPVLVWNYGCNIKKKRYFAGVSKKGKPQAYSCGGTPWSAEGQFASWDNCIKAEEQ